MGLIFLKYISDAFEDLYQALKTAEKDGADPEDRDEYKAELDYVLTPGRYVGLPDEEETLIH